MRAEGRATGCTIAGPCAGSPLRRKIERENPQLAGVLPKTYQGFNARSLKELLKTFTSIPLDLEGDSFGKIYEYFLGEFAMKEGQAGGEFYTPIPIVRLLVEVLEPFAGRVLDRGPRSAR